MFTDLGLYLVGSLIICVRLKTSSLDCRMAGVLSMSQFRSPNNPFPSVTEVNKLEGLGKGSGARPCRINLYITRGAEEE